MKKETVFVEKPVRVVSQLQGELNVWLILINSIDKSQAAIN